MQIRRNENLIFPNVRTNTGVNNNIFLSLAKERKENASATVTISKSGRERARMMNESTKKDEYMKRAESKIDRILDTVRAGGTLSKEEEELVNNELRNMSEQKYKDYKSLRLSQEDVLTELKENYLRRERLFFDMQKQLEADVNSQAQSSDNAKIMAYMQEKENDENLIEMIKEYAEDEEDKEIETKSETGEVLEEETGNQEINLNVGDNPSENNVPEDANLQKKALKIIENIENEMDDVKAATEKSRSKEREFTQGLEEDYKRIQRVLDNEEASVADKVKAYDRFVEEARVNARGREVQRIKKQFDAETLMMARIKMLGQNQIGDESNGSVNNSQIGTDFIKSFLV